MFANEINTQEFIEQSAAVITINSTVGFEALLLGKKVVRDVLRQIADWFAKGWRCHHVCQGGTLLLDTDFRHGGNPLS